MLKIRFLNGIECQSSARQRNCWEFNAIREDPIVTEVDRAREKLAAEYDFDVKAVFADLRKRQASLGDRLVRQKSRAEPAANSSRTAASGFIGDTR